jgi:pimeloyl-ACP methyl ester carboxylesterase
MLPKGWLVEIPNAGHMLMMEDPQAVATSLRQVIQMASK